MPAIVLFNPAAGSGRASEDDLRERFPDADVTPCDGDELRGAVEDAAERSVEFVGVAGGDGTIRTAATVLVGTGTPLLPIPCGTRNHFAKAVGVPDLAAAAAAAERGTDLRIDVGEINGTCFLNNSSLGAYPRFVQRRERHQRRVPKAIAQWIATGQEIRHGRPLVVVIDGRPVRTWLVFVGNGAYGGELGELGARESLTDGLLDIRVVLARGRLPRTRLLLAALVGRLQKSTVVENWTAPALEIEAARSTRLRVACDGEVEVAETPLRYRSNRGALTVRVPLPEDEA